MTAPQISEDAAAAILAWEVSSPAVYERTASRPTWPGGASGVTIGIGYDLGMTTEAAARADWGPWFTPEMAACCGVSGAKARALLPSVAGAYVSFKAASDVFRAKSIPKALRETLAAFPGSEKLSPDSLGALVSVVFNRGASTVDAPGSDRRREMRQIMLAIQGGHYDLVPDLIRSMKRLWVGQGLDGLLARRDAEAALFARGLAVAPAVAPVVQRAPALMPAGQEPPG